MDEAAAEELGAGESAGLRSDTEAGPARLLASGTTNEIQRPVITRQLIQRNPI